MKQGLVGQTLSHSYSKIIHNIFYKITNKVGNYNLYEIKKPEQLEGFFNECKINGVNNINVTIPYKKDVMKYMDHISESAMKIDAINTIDIKDNKLYGYNTDYYGFIKTLEKEDIIVKDTKWVILGSGGASKSVIVALKDLGVTYIKIVSRTKKGKEYIDYTKLSDLKGYDGLVNTTPVGMFPNMNKCVVSEKIIKKFKYAIELIYNPKMTLFLKIAKKNKLKYANGMYMLVAQAIKAQEIWNNEKYNLDIIDEIYEKMVDKL